MVSTSLYGAIKKVIPERPFHLRGFQVPIYFLASLWSILLLFAIVKSDLTHVGKGALALIAIGLALYAMIPKDRRGKIVGVTHDYDELV